MNFPQKTKKELEKEGWKFMDNFADIQIWGKEKKRILWNPRTKVITFEYEIE